MNSMIRYVYKRSTRIGRTGLTGVKLSGVLGRREGEDVDQHKTGSDGDSRRFCGRKFFLHLFSTLRGVYTGDVGLAISLSDVISIPRSIDFKWYIHFKSMPWR